MPTSTDLVTDLPADFEVFGQAVATSMADLLGGTTGQVLAKASNTDMDFTWTAGGDVTLNGTQTLTNKTLTSPVINLGILSQTATTYTFVLSDNSKLIMSSNASAQTLSIPTNATAAFPIGSQINVIQTGAGQVTVSAATPGTTTVMSNAATSAAPKCRNQFAALTAIKVGTDFWFVIGDIA